MERKSFHAEIKANQDEPGTFDALVAVFGNVDKVGDRIDKGAFKRTLKERGLPPLVWSHRWDVPPIGETLSAKETDAGLEIKGRLFVGEGEDHDIARQVYAGMKAGVLREFSFSYDAIESATDKSGSEDVRVLKDLEVYEVGPVLVGCNPATQLLQAPKSVELLTGLPLRPKRVEAPEVQLALTSSGNTFTANTTGGVYVPIKAAEPAPPAPDPDPETPNDPARVLEILLTRSP